MNTIVVRAPTPASPAAPFPAGALPHALQKTALEKTNSAKSRTREAIESPKFNDFFKFGESRAGLTVMEFATHALD
jgi:hypothetical protein